MSASPQTATGPAPGANASGVDESAAEAARNKPIGTAEFRPSAIFSHDMVLQRGKPIVLFGTGTPGRPVVTVLSTADGSALIRRQSSRSITDSVSAIGSIAPDGTWMVTLPPLEAGGPYTLTISDRTSVTLKYFNVMVGEVWIASGQSNIEFELHNDRDADSAIAASDDPLLRFFNVPKFGVVDSELIAAENQSAWRASSPDSCSTMSAIAYYFARKLRRDLGPDVPVGIVDCYIGGTSITSWMSEHMLTATEAGRGYLDRYHQQIDGKTDQQFHDETDSWQCTFNAWNEQIAAAQAAVPDITWDVLNARYGECPWPPPVTPFSQYHVTGAFNAMVRRLAPFSTRGVLWYQGEEDEQRYASYRELLGCMIGEWRTLWSRRAGGDFSDSYDVGRIVADDAARGHGAEPIADTPAASVGNEAELPFIIVQLHVGSIRRNTTAALIACSGLISAKHKPMQHVSFPTCIWRSRSIPASSTTSIRPTNVRLVSALRCKPKPMSMVFPSTPMVPHSFRWHPPAKRPMSCRCVLTTPTACISDHGLGATMSVTYRQSTRLNPGKQNPCGP